MQASPATTRKLQTAGERREAVLEAAMPHFARKGYYGTPTADIAKSAGISQAYLFRLFPTKEELFVVCAEACFDRVREEFERAAAPRAGDPEAMFAAIAQRYDEMLSDRNRLLAQLHSYAACDVPAIRAAVRRGYGRLVDMVRVSTGAPDEAISMFFATGLLLTVSAAMSIDEVDEPWARALMSFRAGAPGC